MKNVNNGGSLHLEQKNCWNPNFCSVSCDEIENGRLFLRLRCPILRQKSLQKPSPWGPAPFFTPTPRLWETPTNTLTPSGWPYPNDHAGMVPVKKAAHKPTERNGQPRHEVEEVTSEQQWRKDNPKMTKRIEKKQTGTQKTPNKQKHTKKEKHKQRRQRIQKMQAQETSWIEQRRINNQSSTPLKHVPTTSNKSMFCGWKTSTKEKKKLIIVQSVFSQSSPKGKQKWDNWCYQFVSFQVRAGAWGEEETKDEKEEEQGEKTQRQEQSNEMHAKKEKIIS